MVSFPPSGRPSRMNRIRPPRCWSSAARLGARRSWIGPLRRLVETGTPPRPARSSSRRRPAGPDACGRRLESSLAHGYERACSCLTPVAAWLLLRSPRGGPARTSRPLATARPPGDRLAMLVERIDELPLEHHDFGGNAACSARRVHPPDRPAEGPPDRGRGRTPSWAERLPRAGPTGRPSASSPRSTVSHEQMLAEAARGTRATWCALMRSPWSGAGRSSPQRFDRGARRRCA